MWRIKDLKKNVSNESLPNAVFVSMTKELPLLCIMYLVQNLNT